MDETQNPIRVVVEVVSSEVVNRLEKENSDLRSEVSHLEKRLESVNRTLYELMEVLAELKRKS